MDLPPGFGRMRESAQTIVAIGFVQQEKRCAQETMKYMTVNV
jgi:hypothetical protein